ncbi:MAG TPA: zinc ribbon domain-containing protein [Candidatus Eremiobacteraeota bacterium]|nr:MAG: hypothetical protein BWY64_03575 [bacterium ADurb.Bin363]HPZ10203.1 zinc ribbon domain-containing protein [Candidatus Eremiobacteraeota bacterium]
MRVCSKCGNSNDDENKFCTTCASPLYETKSNQSAMSVTPGYSSTVTQKKYIETSGKKKPIWIAIASIIPGLGQMIIGQITKGAILLTGAFVLICAGCATSGVSHLALVLLCGFSAFDAFKMAEKANRGERIGEMEFFFQSQKESDNTPSNKDFPDSK